MKIGEGTKLKYEEVASSLCSPLFSVLKKLQPNTREWCFNLIKDEKKEKDDESNEKQILND